MSDRTNAPLPHGWQWDSDGDAVHPDGCRVAYYNPVARLISIATEAYGRVYVRARECEDAGAIDLADAILALARARRRPDLTSQIDLATGDYTPLREVESDEAYAERHGWTMRGPVDWDAPGGAAEDGWWNALSGVVSVRTQPWREWRRAVVSTVRAAVDVWRSIRSEEADRGAVEPDRAEVGADRGEPAAHLTFAGGVAVHVRQDREVRIVLAHVVSAESAPDDATVTVVTSSRDVWRLGAPDPQTARQWCAQIAKQAARVRGGGA